MDTRKRAAPLRGTVVLPGDKSISHRALFLAALARGRSEVRGLNRGSDVAATASCLLALGARCIIDPSAPVAIVESEGAAGLREPASVLDAGNSGTTIRVLLGVTAAIPGFFVMTGDETLRRRPMGRVTGPLRQMGAVIDGRAGGDRAPLAVRGGRLSGFDHHLRVASAQVKTSLLLAGLMASGVTSVTEPLATRDHTERMLRGAGVRLDKRGRALVVEGGQRPEPLSWRVPGDLSSALYLVVAALLVPGSDLVLEGVGLNPTRAGGLGVLARMGADVDIRETSAPEALEPVGTLRARSSALRSTEVGGEEIPSLIDDIPILAIAATQAEGETRFTGAGELRYKESDRIAVMVAGINALGGVAEETSDGLVVGGPASLTGGEIDACGDHRVALAFAVAGLAARDKVRVRGWGAVDTSFPEFPELLRQAQGGRP